MIRYQGDWANPEMLPPPPRTPPPRPPTVTGTFIEPTSAPFPRPPKAIGEDTSRNQTLTDLNIACGTEAKEPAKTCTREYSGFDVILLRSSPDPFRRATRTVRAFHWHALGGAVTVP